ncbi:hypothetical protein TREMEDRAFT_66403 [Tremella mesenterica DSM 1558]|uniref:uncharacterized protein n=1 Tax=Tremella mesenterica (strain ATCC 24925 / CBS 8224 / DSM 1558 / NBRC 9311 / NRRL Y-6157 / RJB 2259-6 / UBC 559-6) TaxID=578456 RepID=UPI00032D5E71|nr:uncharacterized protein TREMEDRAFT_66403 [Tremella mesenterica DSM 1558]EIW65576.1 hypothetical protein TREMEDRAFT_66403 [Tremella mesenterica DSM 1558]
MSIKDEQTWMFIGVFHGVWVKTSGQPLNHRIGIDLSTICYHSLLNWSILSYFKPIRHEIFARIDEEGWYWGIGSRDGCDDTDEHLEVQLFVSFVHQQGQIELCPRYTHSQDDIDQHQMFLLPFCNGTGNTMTRSQVGSNSMELS